MNSLLDNTDEEQERSLHRGGQHKEITLGTTTILLIFFSLAVYGAVLFGFGYSLGSKHTGPAMAQQQTTSTIFGGLKPSPGSPAAAPAKLDQTEPGLASPPAVTPTRIVALPSASEPAEAEPVPSHPAPIVRQPPAAAAVVPVPAAPANPGPPPIPVAVPAGVPTVVVQVAAVSHAEDAEMIAGTLRKRGYLVNIRTEADRLLHVQVGPFANRKEAEAMRARLQADGFNAYVK